MKKVGIVCCSNGQTQDTKPVLERLQSLLLQMDVTPVYSDYIYSRILSSAGAQKREPGL